MEKEEPIHIQLGILQRKFDLWIKKEHENYYREAEKRINDKAAYFAKRWNVTDQLDLLSKLLIELTVNYIAKEEKLNGYEENLIPKIEKLTRLADQMAAALDCLGLEPTDTDTPTAQESQPEETPELFSNVD